MSDVNLTDTEREALHAASDHSDCDCFGAPCPAFRAEVAAVERIVAAREQAARAAALRPIRAFAAGIREAALDLDATYEYRDAMAEVRDDLDRTLAAAGVDAAPNETKTEWGIKHVQGVLSGLTERRASEELEQFRKRGGRWTSAHAVRREVTPWRAAVPSGHEQEGNHRG